jgi:ABC-type multidrug transport system ATPase subunit
LAGIPRSKIREQLIDVGFDDARQSDIVGGLSGGWKMKLELARAMLYNADLLLLDEVNICTFSIVLSLVTNPATSSLQIM